MIFLSFLFFSSTTTWRGAHWRQTDRQISGTERNWYRRVRERWRQRQQGRRRRRNGRLQEKSNAISRCLCWSRDSSNDQFQWKLVSTMIIYGERELLLQKQTNTRVTKRKEDAVREGERQRDHGFLSTFFFCHFSSLLQQCDLAYVYSWPIISNVKNKCNKKKKKKNYEKKRKGKKRHL